MPLNPFGWLVRWLLRRNVKELEHVFTPDPEALEVVARQDRLEELLEDRKLRVYIVQAQVRALKGRTT